MFWSEIPWYNVLSATILIIWGIIAFGIFVGFPHLFGKNTVAALVFGGDHRKPIRAIHYKGPFVWSRFLLDKFERLQSETKTERSWTLRTANINGSSVQISLRAVIAVKSAPPRELVPFHEWETQPLWYFWNHLEPKLTNADPRALFSSPTWMTETISSAFKTWTKTGYYRENYEPYLEFTALSYELVHDDFKEVPVNIRERNQSTPTEGVQIQTTS